MIRNLNKYHTSGIHVIVHKQQRRPPVLLATGMREIVEDWPQRSGAEMLHQ